MRWTPAIPFQAGAPLDLAPPKLHVAAIDYNHFVIGKPDDQPQRSIGGLHDEDVPCALGLRAHLSHCHTYPAEYFIQMIEKLKKKNNPQQRPLIRRKNILCHNLKSMAETGQIFSFES